MSQTGGSKGGVVFFHRGGYENIMTSGRCNQPCREGPPDLILVMSRTSPPLLLLDLTVGTAVDTRDHREKWSD
jgi:hypothetical protein